jgi:hypothetical protein
VSQLNVLVGGIRVSAGGGLCHLEIERVEVWDVIQDGRAARRSVVGCCAIADVPLFQAAPGPEGVA